MSTSLSSAFGDFVHALYGIVANLFNSVLAVLQAILTLGQELLGSLLQLLQAVVSFVLNLFQGAAGFVIANFFALAVIGGVYYWYTSTKSGQNAQRQVKKRT